jgi:adenosylcobinamide-phosphate synthase
VFLLSAVLKTDYGMGNSLALLSAPLNPVLTLALPLAWAIDRWWGEPPNALHPVAWLGLAVGPLGQRLKGCTPAIAFVGGAFFWCAMAGVLVWAAWAVQNALLRASPWLSVPALALLLKPMFAWRMLRDEVVAVEQALVQGLPVARQQLSRLVSRDVSQLDETAVRESAIETLAENLNDSLVAPFFWFAILGLPGAVLYRFANTLDAMWGYRGEWEWAGKFAARADDVLSWLPARLTAFLLLGWRGRGWRLLRPIARLTPSPNGGWPMGAMALRLNVRLGKPGVYVLHAQGLDATSVHVGRSLQRGQQAAVQAVWLATLACAASGLLQWMNA